MFGRKSPLTKLFPSNPITKREFFCFNGDKHKPQKVDWVSGACMVIRRDAIMQVGGFDKRFFMYWEDADLCKRFKEIGWEIVYFPETQVYHYIGKSSDTCQLQSIYHFHKSCYLYFKKHSRWPEKLITPVVLSGLGLRCLFVMGLNRIQHSFNRLKSGALKIHPSRNPDTKSPERIKVLRIVSRLNIGGPSIHCTLLTKGLHKNRFRSKLLIGKTSPHEGEMSYMINSDNSFLLQVPELQREINIFKDTTAFLKILKIVFSYRPDIIHSHTSKAGTLARCAAFLFNIFSKKKTLVVHTYHGHVLEGYFSALKSKLFVIIEKMLARITDAIIAISQTQKWELTEKYQLASAGKVHVINLGFDLSRFLDNRGKGKLRSTFDVEDRTLFIGIVGRLAPIKNHRLFLDSAKLIKERNPDKSIRYAIIGDGELKEHLKTHAQTIGIENNVIFYGWEKEIEKIYADLDILVLTSNNEGTPVSIIESMASSVPVVTTGVGGIKDLLGRIETRAQTKDDFSICERGILCSKGNANAIANGIQYLIESDNQNLTNKAREYVFKNYSEKRLIERIENLYLNLR
jgi:glycosyltransferase involved in cell wall biosynthesis